MLMGPPLRIFLRKKFERKSFIRDFLKGKMNTYNYIELRNK